MKYIFIIICSIIYSTYSFKQTKPKLCINCKFFITDNNTDKFGKCSLFSREPFNDTILVNGIIENKDIDYFYASIARSTKYNDMCGKEGKMHVRKYIKKHLK
jgi:hypothetical protein